MKAFFDIARELFPQLPNDDIFHILWEYTGYPCFWDIHGTETTEDCCRRQLMEFKEKSNLELL